MQQIEGVGAQRTRRELANALGIKERVGPEDLPAAFIE
jgi:hypothetical protein